ncbi:Hvo_1808 family surface protein [Halapricum desulfuricans]|nr:Hvo_1808 family surface protein [Halapricum desulfuricans]
MRMRLAVVAVLLLAVAVVSIGAVGGTVPASESPLAQSSNDTANEAPPDPEADRLGWEDGRWYNESIDVTPEDGLNDTELDLVVARGMARVEHVRGLEFEETPPVEVISRDEFREETGSRYGNVTESQRLAENVYYEALLMVDESTDAVGVQQSNTAGGVGGYYDPASGEIKIVSENTDTPQMNEITLSQELFHALQDQKFNISSFNQSTQELHNARDGIIEGDGNYVDYLYQQSCENEWDGECIMPEDGGTPSDFDPHFGLYQIQLQPYSDGPAFVSDLHEEEGWEAVNEVYENPPASTEQTIHPDKYGADAPTNVTVEDTSSEDWRPLDVANGTDYESFGEAGLYVTLWYPGYESQGQTQIIEYNNHLNLDGQSLDEIDPYNYDHPYTAGWDGDRLVPYVTDDSFETNETGYVYEMVWDSEDDATEFLDGYEQLLEYRGAEPIQANESTYRIADSERFDDAFYVEQDGANVTIVNAPTVEALSDIRAGAAPADETDPGDDTPADEPTDTQTDEPTDSPSETTTETGDGFGPGFGVLAAALATIAVALVAARRL